MQNHVLDKSDLKILAMLGRDGRMSYRSMGSSLGRSTNTVKSRVSHLISSRVIEKFIVKVNFASLGYQTTCIIGIRHNDTPDVASRLALLGELFLQVDCVNGVSFFGLAIKDGMEEKIRLLDRALKPARVQSLFVRKTACNHKLSETDLKIIKYLLSDPRKGVSEIARDISVSTKTIARRLDKMISNNVLHFSILVNPGMSIGYIQFVVLVHIEKFLYHGIIIESRNTILKNHFAIPIILRDDVVAFYVFGENVSSIDSILRKVESLKGIKKTDVLILQRETYYQDWLIREIEQRISSESQSGILDKSRSVKPLAKGS